MRLNRRRLKVGDLCYFNPENTLKLKVRSTITVKITSIIRKPFKPTVYNCYSMQRGNMIQCNENLLLKVDSIDDEPLLIEMRYADDVPPITESDIETLSKLETLFSKSNKDIELLSDIKKIKTKLEFYYSIFDV